MSFHPSDDIGELIMSARRACEFRETALRDPQSGWQRDLANWNAEIVQRLSEIELDGDFLAILGSRQTQRLVRLNNTKTDPTDLP